MTEDELAKQNGITIFTIGFARKSAQNFFDILQQAGVKKIVDVRLNNVSQLAGFTKKHDLAYFLREIGGIDYVHLPDLAPTKEILDGYKKKNISWAEYEERFANIMAERQIENRVTPRDLEHTCFLCSEPEADKCHRRLLAEYLQSKWENVDIQHL